MNAADVIRWIVLALVAVTVVFELATGTARLRGMAPFRRADAPRAYWGAVALKVFIGLAIAATMLLPARAH
jgi:hypothetical protein